MREAWGSTCCIVEHLAVFVADSEASTPDMIEGRSWIDSRRIRGDEKGGDAVIERTSNLVENPTKLPPVRILEYHDLSFFFSSSFPLSLSLSLSLPLSISLSLSLSPTHPPSLSPPVPPSLTVPRHHTPKRGGAGMELTAGVGSKTVPNHKAELFDRVN